MHVFDRPVHFQDVDAAGIVFYARFFAYTHDAMVSLFDELPGRYAGLINDRKLGLPVVHLEADYKAPLRFGDVARVSLEVVRIGNKSVEVRYVIRRGEVECAVVHCTVVLTDFTTMKGIPVPPDVRALLERHLAAG